MCSSDLKKDIHLPSALSSGSNISALALTATTTNIRCAFHWHEAKDKSCALHWSRPVSYDLELTNCVGCRQVALAVAKDKKICVAQAVTRLRWQSPKIKDRRCAGRRQRLKIRIYPVCYHLGLTFSAFTLTATTADIRCTFHWHKVKDKKLRVTLVSPSFVLPGVNKLRGPSPSCAGGRQR